LGVSHRAAAQDQPTRSFPQRLPYTAGTIRPDHRSQRQLDDDVRAAYDRWKATYLVPADDGVDGLPRFRVAFAKPGEDNHAVTVSEGQGFGLIAVAHLAGHDPAAQLLFDGLWRFCRDNPSAIDARLMNWHVPPDPNGNASAFDGDCDVAYGLLLADAQWGSDGQVDYAGAARQVLDGILTSTIGPRSRLPMLGDWVDPDGPVHNQHTPRTSDFMLGHFRAFAHATGDPVWAEIVAACQTVVTEIQGSASLETGLLPDFVQPTSPTDPTPRPAEPGFLEGPRDGAYAYNAGRVPWRLGCDALLHGDPVSIAQVRKISHWIEAVTDGDPPRIRAGYTLDGTPLPNSDYFTTFFAAPFAVAAMTAPDQQQWLNDLYDAVYDRRENYYEDTVTLLCLLVMTGNFWSPMI
jgi:endo-1,4-beta-D-glucanase Y